MLSSSLNFFVKFPWSSIPPEGVDQCVRFWQKNSHQRNDKSEINTFNRMRSALLSHTWIFWSFLELSSDDLIGEMTLKKFRKWKLKVISPNLSWPMRLPDSLIINMSGRNQEMFSTKSINMSNIFNCVWLGKPSRTQKY